MQVCIKAMHVNLMPRRHSAEVWQTVGHAATPLLSLERHAVQAVLLVKALQAPQAMSSETQHACWRIWWWRRWCCICGAQKEIRRATRPALEDLVLDETIEIYCLSCHHVSSPLKLETGLFQQALPQM